jgi:hypothetical protein
MNAKEELIKLLMESYDRGVKDAKQEALTALDKVVAVMVADEREECAKILDANAMACESPIWRSLLQSNAQAIRVRGQA